MARYFVTHQSVEIDCGTVVVHMTTNTLRHLWLLWSVTPPTTNPVPFRGQESTVPHSNNFTVFIDGDVEQEEPGNTQTHTFRFPWPLNAEALFFYSIDFGTGNTKSTRSPIFVYILTLENVFTETFADGHLDPSLPWSPIVVPPGAELSFPSNSLHWRVHYSGLATGSITGIGAPEIERLRELNNCTMSVTMSIPKYSGFNIGQRPAITMGWIEPHSATSYTAMFVPDLDYDYMHYGPLLGPNGAYFIIGNKRRSFTFRDIAFAVGATVPVSWQNPLDDQMNAVVFGFWMGNGTNVLNIADMFFGPISVDLTWGALTDVSASWKGRRLAPRFR